MKLTDYLLNMSLLIIFATSLSTCSSTRLTPRYKGVDPGLIEYSADYIRLAKERGIKFDTIVTMGFNDLPYPVIGRCYYSLGFREIDIDRNFWKNASEITRMALVLHESSHCYCGRPHDYGAGKEYPEAAKLSSMNKVEGFFPDGCPLSLMFPEIVDDGCVMYHYQDYIEELFQRCEPY
jgi:hypothetical protein